MCNHTPADHTIAQCRAAVEADPSSAQKWRQLGIALLLGASSGGDGGGGNAERTTLKEAASCLRRALQLTPPAPNRAGTRHALGLALLRSGDPAAACDELERACELRPRDARLRADLGRALKEAGRLGAAAEAYRAAIRLRDDDEEGEQQGEQKPAPLHYRLGMTLRAMLSSPRHCRSASQRRKLAREARRCLARQLIEDPNHALAAFWLAALAPEVEGGGGSDDDDDAEAATASVSASARAAGGCPPQMVAALFDKYAPTFDDHLVGALDYATPRRLADALASAAAAAAQNGSSGGNDSNKTRFFRRVADLGCGTGLMGPLLRPMMMLLEDEKEEDDVLHLCGVDLSPRMVEVARGRGCYDSLEVGELVAWLLQKAASSSSLFDCLVAADVVVYLGDLAPMLEAAGSACSGPGALFAFSTEDADAGENEDEGEDDDKGGARDQGDDINSDRPGFVLRPTGRYAHRAAYLRSAAEAAGWGVVSLERRSPLRMNAGKRIWGNLVVLRRRV